MRKSSRLHFVTARDASGVTLYARVRKVRSTNELWRDMFARFPSMAELEIDSTLPTCDMHRHDINVTLSIPCTECARIRNGGTR